MARLSVRLEGDGYAVDGERGRLFGGRYRVVATLGDGGMARVYKAVDERLGRLVAVKTLHPQYNTQPVFVARFEGEARLAAGLSHPNTISVYDIGRDDDGVHYIVMEYVEGETLKHLIRREAPLPLPVCTAIVRQILLALDDARARGVVHRDIKPENIFLTPARQVKVGDFGIARALDATSVTPPGMVLGSVSYFSPEQALGQPATAQSDLYAAGVVLYEMLTGRLPFVAESPLAVAIKHVDEAPAPPSVYNPLVPPAVDAVALRALDKDPARRFYSGAALADALAGAAATAPPQGDTYTLPAGDDATVVATTASAPRAPRPQPPTERLMPANAAAPVDPEDSPLAHPRPAVAAGPAATIGARSLAASAIRPAVAPRTAHPAPPVRPRRRSFAPLVGVLVLVGALAGGIAVRQASSQGGRRGAAAPVATATPLGRHVRARALPAATHPATPTLPSPTVVPPTGVPPARATQRVGTTTRATGRRRSSRPVIAAIPTAGATTVPATDTASPTHAPTSGPNNTSYAAPATDTPTNTATRIPATDTPTDTATDVPTQARATDSPTAGAAGGDTPRGQGGAIAAAEAAVTHADDVYEQVYDNRDTSGLSSAFTAYLVGVDSRVAQTLAANGQHWRITRLSLSFTGARVLDAGTVQVSGVKTESAIKLSDTGQVVEDHGTYTMTFTNIVKRVDGAWLVDSVG